MTFDNRFKVMTLWLILIICMILHFDYHISKAVYGIDIRLQNANGTIPEHLLYIRAVFHFLPLLYIAVIMWSEKLSVRFFNLILSIIYSLAHCFHFAVELRKGENPSQIILLSITAILSLILFVTSYYWFRNGRLLIRKQYAV